MRRGDAVVAQLVAAIQRSSIWTWPPNVADVITFDEGGSAPRGVPQGCGSDRNSPANFGGGHIPTIVITNHGPRGKVDDTPYNHYSLPIAAPGPPPRMARSTTHPHGAQGGRTLGTLGLGTVATAAPREPFGSPSR